MHDQPPLRPLHRLICHLMCMAVPVGAIAYLATAPHPGWLSALAVASVFIAGAYDVVAPPNRRPPPASLPDWVFDGTLVALVLLQLVNVALLVRLASSLGLADVGTWVGVFISGIASATSIVVAHELVHRPTRWMQRLGRLVLVTVLYEHFYTEHLRGHHVRVATEQDPASARHGERFWAFFVRTVPSQFISAWRIEARRTGASGLVDPRWLRSRVLHGLIASAATVALISAVAGLAVFAFVAQALWAVVLLEAVNYIEHWGLRRAERRVQTVDSWDSESWFTYYSLVGLARHADHHAWAARPYQALRCYAESPKLPWGYWACALTAVFADFLLLPHLDAELRRTKLGPYRATDSSEGSLPFAANQVVA